MNIQVFDRWMILGVRFVNGAFWLTYKDDAGTRRELPRTPSEGLSGWQAITPSPRWQSLDAPIYVPGDLESLLETVIAAFPSQRFGPHAQGPAPAPIFVDAPTAALGEVPELPSDYSWQSFVEHLPPLLRRRERVQLVALTGSRWMTRSPFRLPLRVLAVGTRCADALTSLQSASWYTSDTDVQIYGLHFETAKPAQLAKALRAEIREVVIVEKSEVAALFKAVARLADPANRRPRLVIVPADGVDTPWPRETKIPPGVAVLWIPNFSVPTVEQFTREFFYGIIHNYPLHEALKTAMRAVSTLVPTWPSPVLFADPLTNASLRLSDTLTQMEQETMALNQTVAKGDLDTFLQRMGEESPSARRVMLLAALEERQPIRMAAGELGWARETTGLAPLAKIEAGLTEARNSEQKIRTMLAPLLRDQAFLTAFEKHQERRVDVALEAVLPESMTYSFVQSREKLVKGGRYRLRVHIGRPADNSLVIAEPPPLDPLLPAPDGEAWHCLEVVVFEKDFSLLSPRVQALQLLPLRGSAPVYFELTAPQLAAAELRIGIYHRNHLLQCFILEAQLSEARWQYSEALAVTVRLKFSRTARFTNLDQLAPRALSISVNQDRESSSHTFMLKLNEQAEPLKLTEAIINEAQKNFRQMLQAATADSTGNPRFATFPAPGAPPSPEFEAELRKLADFGHQLYQAIFIRSDKKMRPKLRELAARADDTIQIVRLDPNFAFPWPVLYDFALPPKIAGASPAPVCLGTNGNEANGETKCCAHGPQDKVYCMYGFWGLRHRVEQLVDLGDNLVDAVDEVQPNPRSGVCLAVGEVDNNTEEMARALRAQLGPAVVELAAGDDLLDVLWETQKRPAILVALGHLQTTDIVGEPVGPRLVLQPQKKWLQANLVTARQMVDGDWEQPRTLVLLMACGSAATDITTLNDLVTAFTSVRAAAIAGTECVVFPRLAARFTQEITLALWNGMHLGEAVLQFNRRLTGSGNPLAFVFNYLGDADFEDSHLIRRFHANEIRNSAPSHFIFHPDAQFLSGIRGGRRSS